ncbi:hypothetical protein F4779DRAFT_641663 [Xylariaceae sp. FL0662B]|nr:hypothetical protein F4779DRAFT_641663 [Xylariaceae sp. FL0662B]
MALFENPLALADLRIPHTPSRTFSNPLLSNTVVTELDQAGRRQDQTLDVVFTNPLLTVRQGGEPHSPATWAIEHSGTGADQMPKNPLLLGRGDVRVDKHPAGLSVANEPRVPASRGERRLSQWGLTRKNLMKLTARMEQNDYALITTWRNDVAEIQMGYDLGNFVLHQFDRVPSAEYLCLGIPESQAAPLIVKHALLDQAAAARQAGRRRTWTRTLPMRVMS